MKQIKTNLERKAQVKPLNEIHKVVAAKRDEDLLRFRTCCADVRASK